MDWTVFTGLDGRPTRLPPAIQQQVGLDAGLPVATYCYLAFLMLLLALPIALPFWVGVDCSDSVMIRIGTVMRLAGC